MSRDRSEPRGPFRGSEPPRLAGPDAGPDLDALFKTLAALDAMRAAADHESEGTD